jgi:hypothetical protein
VVGLVEKCVANGERGRTARRQPDTSWQTVCSSHHEQTKLPEDDIQAASRGVLPTDDKMVAGPVSALQFLSSESSLKWNDPLF